MIKEKLTTKELQIISDNGKDITDIKFTADAKTSKILMEALSKIDKKLNQKQ